MALEGLKPAVGQARPAWGRGAPGAPDPTNISVQLLAWAVERVLPLRVHSRILAIRRSTLTIESNLWHESLIFHIAKKTLDPTLIK